VKSLLIAAGPRLSFCRATNTSAGYLMQGASPYIAGGRLILLWPLVAGVLVIIRAWNQPPEA
jgi:hypothetical protein